MRREITEILREKMFKRVGLTAYAKSDGKTGKVISFGVSEGLEVTYVLDTKDGIIFVPENDIVIMIAASR